MRQSHRVSFRIHEDLHAKLTALADTNGWTIARCLSECLDLADVAQTCRKIEVVFGERTEGPTVTIWVPAKERSNGSEPIQKQEVSND